MKRLHWALVLLVALLPERAALGQTPVGPAEQSPGLAEGDRYWDESDFVRAHATFEREYKQTGLLSAGLKSARALVRLGRLLEASVRYEELITADRPNGGGDPASVRQDAAVDLQQLLSRIPRIVISVVGAPARAVAIALNGVRVASPPPSAGVPVNPGRYLITGILRGRTVEQYVDVGEGDVEAVRLRFGPPGFGGDATSLNTNSKGAQPGTVERTRGLGGQRVVGVVTLGVGAAALVTGGVIGWSAMKDEESLERRCPDRRCPQKLDSEVDAYEAKKLIALVGVGAGGLLLAGGAVLTFTAPSTRTEPRVGAFVTPSGAGVWGAF